MITLLIDYNMDGLGIMLTGTYQSEGWAELLPIRFVRFRDVGLPANSSDRLFGGLPSNIK